MTRGISEAVKNLGITGTPGTGKKTVARLLSKMLGTSVLELNRIASRVAEAPTAVGQRELVVSPLRLRSEFIKARAHGTIVYGHLLPSLGRVLRPSLVTVLRCNPSTLKVRLANRGYSREKMVSNLEAELIGVVLDESIRAFGTTRVVEYDTTRVSPSRIARRIAVDWKMANAGTSRPSRGVAWIDWSRDYDSAIKLRSLFEGSSNVPGST